MKTKKESLQQGYTIPELASKLAPFMMRAAFEFWCANKTEKHPVSMITVFYTQEQACLNMSNELVDVMSEHGFEPNGFSQIIGNYYGIMSEHKEFTLSKIVFHSKHSYL